MDSINGISYYLNKCQLSEICDFHVSTFRQVVQKHKLFEVA